METTRTGAPRKIVAIMSADVAGYSRLMGRDEEGTYRQLCGHLEELFIPTIGAFTGRIIKFVGDGLLAEFASAVDAIRCAAALQQAMARRNGPVPAESRLQFRIGLHVGDVIHEGGDIFGDGVNTAARVEGAAPPGGITVSRIVFESVRRKVELSFEDLGEKMFKSFEEPVQVFRVAGFPPPPPPARDGAGRQRIPEGTVLSGIYEVGRLIAVGGMGEVYRGRTVEGGDPVAIKVLLPELADNEAALALFRKEASVLHRLSHDAIVRTYVFTVDRQLGEAFLAMEYVDGVSLLERLGTGPLSVEETDRLRLRLANAMAEAHAAGIVHRDLSPDNVILPEGRVARSKIIDFGIARSLRPTDRTVIGTGFAGKLGYVSPEQLGLYGGEVGPASDVYSLGLTLTAALRGSPLDMEGTQVEVVEKRRAVPDLSDVPARYRPLIARMLEPDPGKRMASMEEVAAWRLGERGAPAASPTLAGRAGWRVPAAALAVLLLAGAGAGGWSFLAGPGGREAAVPPAEGPDGPARPGAAGTATAPPEAGREGAERPASEAARQAAEWERRLAAERARLEAEAAVARERQTPRLDPEAAEAAFRRELDAAFRRQSAAGTAIAGLAGASDPATGGGEGALAAGDAGAADQPPREPDTGRRPPADPARDDAGSAGTVAADAAAPAERTDGARPGPSPAERPGAAGTAAARERPTPTPAQDHPHPGRDADGGGKLGTAPRETAPPNAEEARAAFRRELEAAFRRQATAGTAFPAPSAGPSTGSGPDHPSSVPGRDAGHPARDAGAGGVAAADAGPSPAATPPAAPGQGQTATGTPLRPADPAGGRRDGGRGEEDDPGEATLAGLASAVAPTTGGTDRPSSAPGHSAGGAGPAPAASGVASPLPPEGRAGPAADGTGLRSQDRETRPEGARPGDGGGEPVVSAAMAPPAETGRADRPAPERADGGPMAPSGPGAAAAASTGPTAGVAGLAATPAPAEGARPAANGTGLRSQDRETRPEGARPADGGGEPVVSAAMAPPAETGCADRPAPDRADGGPMPPSRPGAAAAASTGPTAGGAGLAATPAPAEGARPAADGTGLRSQDRETRPEGARPADGGGEPVVSAAMAPPAETGRADRAAPDRADGGPMPPSRPGAAAAASTGPTAGVAGLAATPAPVDAERRAADGPRLRSEDRSDRSPEDSRSDDGHRDEPVVAVRPAGALSETGRADGPPAAHDGPDGRRADAAGPGDASAPGVPASPGPAGGGPPTLDEPRLPAGAGPDGREAPARAEPVAPRETAIAARPSSSAGSGPTAGGAASPRDGGDGATAEAGESAVPDTPDPDAFGAAPGPSASLAPDAGDRQPAAQAPPAVPGAGTGAGDVAAAWRASGGARPSSADAAAPRAATEADGRATDGSPSSRAEPAPEPPAVLNGAGGLSGERTGGTDDVAPVADAIALSAPAADRDRRTNRDRPPVAGAATAATAGSAPPLAPATSGAPFPGSAAGAGHETAGAVAAAEPADGGRPAAPPARPGTGREGTRTEASGTAGASGRHALPFADEARPAATAAATGTAAPGAAAEGPTQSADTGGASDEDAGTDVVATAPPSEMRPPSADDGARPAAGPGGDGGPDGAPIPVREREARRQGALPATRPPGEQPGSGTAATDGRTDGRTEMAALSPALRPSTGPSPGAPAKPPAGMRIDGGRVGLAPPVARMVETVDGLNGAPCFFAAVDEARADRLRVRLYADAPARIEAAYAALARRLPFAPDVLGHLVSPDQCPVLAFLARGPSTSPLAMRLRSDLVVAGDRLDGAIRHAGTGPLFLLVDGDGLTYDLTPYLESRADAAAFRIEIGAAEGAEATPNLVLAVAPPAGARPPRPEPLEPAARYLPRLAAALSGADGEAALKLGFFRLEPRR